jgi:3-deoxy-manno-octulosonate cytidylyltransferase (CMP-KDO synthetase)
VTAIIVIPARYGSSRFPGKPLARQTGKFLIQHVVEQAGRARRASQVVVATDDPRIMDAVHSFGGQAVMTSHAHNSGTDRIAEVMKKPEFAGVQVVVNVQGDEPEIDPNLIDELIRTTSLVDSGRGPVQMATAAAPFEHPRDIENPNIVKVVVDQHHLALYFSRAVIPYDRDGLAAGTHPAIHPAPPAPAGIYRKHLGIYAYRREALLALAATPMCDLERLEKLEQLRALYLGFKIFVHDTTHAPHGIDTPADYAAFVKRHQETVKASGSAV